MNDHEAFYAVTAQILPLLLLTNFIEFFPVRGRPLERPGLWTLPTDEAKQSLGLAIAEVDELIARTEPLTSRGRTFREATTAWLARFIVPIYSGVALLTCVMVLQGIAPDTAFTRYFVQWAIVVQVAAFVGGLWLKGWPGFDAFFAARRETAVVVADLKRIRANLQAAAVQSQSAGLEATPNSPSGAGHHGTDNETSSGTQGDNDGSRNPDKP